MVKKDEKRMDNLKQELELDVNKVPFDELYKRFSSNLDTGWLLLEIWPQHGKVCVQDLCPNFSQESCQVLEIFPAYRNKEHPCDIKVTLQTKLTNS